MASKRDLERAAARVAKRGGRRPEQSRYAAKGPAWRPEADADRRGGRKDAQ